MQSTTLMRDLILSARSSARFIPLVAKQGPEGAVPNLALGPSQDLALDPGQNLAQEPGPRTWPRPAAPPMRGLQIPLNATGYNKERSRKRYFTRERLISEPVQSKEKTKCTQK